MKAWCITETDGLTQQELDTSAWTFCKRIRDNADISHTGAILYNYGGGHYIVDNPNPTEDAIFQTVVTHSGSPYILEGVFSEDNSDMLETVLNRLLEQKVEGSIVTVAPSPIGEITLYQNNDYPEFELTLGPQWSPYLDGSYIPFFTIKEEIVDGETLSEASGTVIDQGQGTLSLPLTKDHTNLTPKKYMWQVQLRKPDIDPDLPPLSLKVAASGILHMRPTLKLVGTSSTNDAPAMLAPMITVTAAYTLLPTDYYVLANGTFTLTLPSAVGLAGKLFRVKNIGTGVITVNPVMGQTIDGQSTKVLSAQYDAIKIVSDGTSWALF